MWKQSFLMVSFVKKTTTIFYKTDFDLTVLFSIQDCFEPATHPPLSLRHCNGFHRSWKSYFHQFKCSQQPLGALARFFLCTAANGMGEIFISPSVPFILPGRQWVGCRMLIWEGRCSDLLSLQALALGILLAWRGSPRQEPALEAP